MNETTVRIQDDLYEAVNGEWLKTAVIPEDRPTAGGFSQLDQDVEQRMMADFRAFAAGEKHTDIPEMRYAVALYRKVLDAQRRNREGIAPALPLLLSSDDDWEQIRYQAEHSGIVSFLPLPLFRKSLIQGLEAVLENLSKERKPQLIPI